MTTSIISRASDGGLGINGVEAVTFNAGGVTSKIQSINGTVAASALTLTLNPCVLDFRSATLSSGDVFVRSNASLLSLVVPAGATLGVISGIQSRLAVIAFISGGAINQLGVVNLSGGTQLDETNLLNTVIISGASNSNNVVYTSLGGSGLPYRVVGYIESTQATAGTWATAPSKIQGYGGQALAAMSSLGYGQTWQAVTRTSGTTYYNTTGKPITLVIYLSAGAAQTTTINVNGLNLMSTYVNNTTGVISCATAIIPVGAYYSITDGGSPSRSNHELR